MTRAYLDAALRDPMTRAACADPALAGIASDYWQDRESELAEVFALLRDGVCELTLQQSGAIKLYRVEDPELEVGQRHSTVRGAVRYWITRRVKRFHLTLE